MNQCSQRAAILVYLKHGGSLSVPQAIDLFDCHRLAARIHELRRQGHPIRSHRIGRWAHYSLLPGRRR